MTSENPNHESSYPIHDPTLAAEQRSSQEAAERVALGDLLDATFENNTDSIIRAEDGTEQLTLYMPYRSSSMRRGAGVATLSLVRTKTEGGSITDANFSSKSAWGNNVRITQEGGTVTMADLRRPLPEYSGSIYDSLELLEQDRSDVPLTPSTDKIQFNKPNMWIGNLTNATPEKPGKMARAKLRLLGGSALK